MRKRKDHGRYREIVGLCGVEEPVQVGKLQTWEPGGPSSARRGRSDGPGREPPRGKPAMHAAGKWEDAVVAEKVLNKAPKGEAEGLEGSGSIKENIGKSSRSLTQGREIVSQGLAGVREVAKKDKRDKRVRFTALLHHVTERLLVDSFYALKNEAAPGVDRVRWSGDEQRWQGRI